MAVFLRSKCPLSSPKSGAERGLLCPEKLPIQHSGIHLSYEGSLRDEVKQMLAARAVLTFGFAESTRTMQRKKMTQTRIRMPMNCCFSERTWCASKAKFRIGFSMSSDSSTLSFVMLRANLRSYKGSLRDEVKR